MFNRVSLIWRRLVHRNQVEADLQGELRAYLDQLSDEKIGQGMTAQDARRAALIEIGGIEQVKEACRDEWSLRWLDSVAADVRYGFRSFARTPAFFFTVVATIGLGLGLNTALFTVFDAYVLRARSLPDPYSLYEFTWTTRSGQGHVFNRHEVDSLRRQSRVFSDVLVAQRLLTRMKGSQTFGELVSGNYFTMLGAGVERGRPLLPEDAAIEGNGTVIVLAYDTWRAKFAADPAILGRKVYLRGQPVEVVGIAKRGFTGLGSIPVEFWVPLTLAPLIAGGRQDALFLTVTGRLKPGVPVEQAAAALGVWSKQMTADRPESERASGTMLVSRATSIPLRPEVLAAMAPVFTAFTLVILIACANVSNMMLARAVARQREISMRVSLGAARSRLIQQLLTESLLLAIPAALAGLVISEMTLRLAQRAVLATIPPAYAFAFQLPDLSLDIRVFSFVILAALGSILIFGLMPAIQITRSSLTVANRGDFGNSFRPSRLRDALAVGQVTVCVLLLICSAVVLRSRERMSHQGLGMQTRGVFYIRASEGFRARVAERLRQDLGRGGAAATVWNVPLTRRLRTIPVTPVSSSISILAGYNFVSPEYFPTLRIPIIAGRNFTSEEARAEGPAVILSKATARLFWPNRNPLGQSIRIDRDNSPNQWDKQPIYRTATVIGIAGDAVSGYVGDGVDSTCIYFPTSTGASGNESLLVRMEGDTSAASRLLKDAVDSVAPNAADQIAAIDESLALQLYPFQVMLWISSCLGGIALLLAATGIYGVMAYLVNQRTKEFGIRMALGATVGNVMRAVLSQSLSMALWGAALGVSLALAISPLFAHELEAVDPYDSAAYVAGALLGVLAALTASFFPLRHAARIDPASSLRCD
ncbi:MAG TPA: ADOP family duplicated permease [Bryobacteraceae bacterium]|nr:ADOP family duplicated permease [Bryobacteraceae bacterium]